MGTRGIMGVRVNNQDKIAYNHFDSYPDGGLGFDMIEKLHTLLKDGEDLRALATQLQPVSGEPTQEDIDRLKKYADTRVSTQKLTEWYVLLRETQGDLKKFLDAGVYECGESFAHDSLYCEYGYIANLDEGVLECYKGFQKGTHDKGRFAACTGPEEAARQTKSFGYYYSGIALVGVVPFVLIRDSVEQAQAAMMELYADKDDEEEAA